ncbi:MAG TPA: GNAT family N-acetyltransferase [bacterium]|nr:GNAT family N-acetyltransferase [bacterium]HPN44050.1 GNAT family N-acetyltransferase [bacterium]
MLQIRYDENGDLPQEQVLALYRALHWSSAQKPVELINALRHSHTVITAWDGDTLVGLGNAISDGYLVVYYPHLAVLPAYQGQGIGRELVRRLREKYNGFHQQALIADGGAIEFYIKCGFVKAGKCEALWVYDGHDHD